MQMQPFFTDDQIQKLKAMLNNDLIREVDKGRGKFPYIEGVTAIYHANNIFGFGMWESNVISLNPVYQDKNKLAIQAVIQIIVHSPFDYSRTVAYTDVGYGSMANNKFDLDISQAFEKAGKEAVTDGMKRAFRMLGNQFGLALYDKDETNGINIGTDEDLAELVKNRNMIRALAGFTKGDEHLLDTNSKDELRAVYREIKAREKANAHVEG
jgi:DNA recombination protein Rad52